MPSLRKRVSSYFRQLSFHNESREKRFSVNENSFVTKYLQGLIKLQEGPPVISGKTPTDLPNYELGTYKIGSECIIGCFTGPNGGLTTVKRAEKHLSIAEAEIDFIDTQEENASNEGRAATKRRAKPGLPIDNSTMVIKVGGQEYFVTDTKKQKSQSLGSLSDLNGAETAVESTRAEASNNNDEAVKCMNEKSSSKKSRSRSNSGSRSSATSKRNVQLKRVEKRERSKEKSYELSKSKSEGNPFQHKKKGRIIRIERPTSTVSAALDVTDASSLMKIDLLLPVEWNRISEHIYGLCDSLYDRNLVTKLKNGDPIADCFGVIAREDSAILAVADGVNWGEKASIAAKSAVHGSLHYLNKTIFNDTKPFESLSKSETPLHDARTTNTRDVFVCLLRAFNCAHDLILENDGMLTTLTVAVILPLESPDAYVCCCCNVGDTLAYVYSQRHGVRELTKGSHDVSSDRDMRDALGALGPVDGTNPELSNLTLSVTKVYRGDIVFVASDGLTDNFDPNVCKFAVNSGKVEPIKPRRDVKVETVDKNKPPAKPPRKNHNNRPKPVDSNLNNRNSNRPLPHNKPPSFNRALSMNDDSNIPDLKKNNYIFLRSKTSIDLRRPPKPAIQRNPDGLPYITPIQRYDLTLLLMEDILKNGISGRENRCVTARKLCENLMSFTMSITAAKRHTLEDNEMYFDNRNGVLVEVTNAEKKTRRKRALERVQNLPGKLDHVTVVGINVGDFSIFR